MTLTYYCYSYSNTFKKKKSLEIEYKSSFQQMNKQLKIFCQSKILFMKLI